MPDADDSASTPDGARATHRIDIGGSTGGPVIAGDHNVVVDARHGSRVTVLAGPERPRPRRRPRAAVLPRSMPEPVGREDETRALAAAVRAGGPVQVWGPPGTGKTTLLRHAARRLPPGPDGVVFLGGAHRGVEDLAQDVFEACYEAPGYAPTRAELQRLMTGVRVTVYIDDADLTSDQLLELMDTAPQAVFVLAGVERSLWSEGTALELRGLSRTAGLELLARELGGPVPEADRETAADLWRAADGLPLPLLRAAALARSGPAAGGRLPRAGQVTALLPALLDSLAQDAPVMEVLRLLATLDGAEVAAAHIGALTDVPEPEAVCDRLVRLGLARNGEQGYGSVADTVPVLRRRFPAPFPAERLCDHFVRWASLGETTPPELASQGPVLEKAAEVAEAAGRPDLAVALARASSPGLARSLRLGVWGRLLGRGWVASRAAGDRRAEGYFLHEEAVRALLIGRRVVYAALLAEAARLGYSLGDTGASAHGSAGAAHGSAGGGGADGGAGAHGGVGGDGGAGAHGGVGGDGGAGAHGGVGGDGGAGAHGGVGGDGGAGTHGGVGGDGGAGVHAGAGAHTGAAPPHFDVHQYMGGNGLGPAAHPGAPTGPGIPAHDGGASWGGSSGHGGGSSWGSAPGHDGGASSVGAPGHGGTGASAASGHGGTSAAPPTGDGGASSGAASPSGGGGAHAGAGHAHSALGSASSHTAAASGSASATAATAGTAAAGMSTVVTAVVSLVAACALVGGLGYAISSGSSGDDRPGDARGGAVPTPSYSISFSLPAGLTESPTASASDPFALPAGCTEYEDAQMASDERGATAPVTNPAADEAWAADESQTAQDLSAAADVATDPAVKSGIQQEAADHAALSTAITAHDLAGIDQYVKALDGDTTAMLDLCSYK
ncbi:hypothetical protein Shyhy01_49540 [Streptomyces hygroscopicus subsp. hygroscopicus]|nr:AAA family ATPase [Streptomyces hygroscopicus]GLX52004.1 hypothetical protein Shyhy01_49540 [Streptomyces hygroscopicus subsp. hygroscopicus]